MLGLVIAGVVLDARSGAKAEDAFAFSARPPARALLPIAPAPSKSYLRTRSAVGAAYAHTVTTAVTGLLGSVSRNAALGFSDLRELDVMIGRLASAYDRISVATPPPALAAVHRRMLAGLERLRGQLQELRSALLAHDIARADAALTSVRRSALDLVSVGNEYTALGY